VSSRPEFHRDLYRGTARYYDEFRLPYPQTLLDDLLDRTGATGSGRLLDLACGTGQISFDVASHYAEVWAVDQESEAIELAGQKAERVGINHIRWIVARAEEIEPDGVFDLVTIGNAFHRLDRPVVARRIRQCLTPGGYVALLWCNSPWDGGLEWQRVMAEVMEHWRATAGTNDRVPSSPPDDLAEQPHADVLRAAGLTIEGEFEFATPHEWTVRTLTGFVYSTSILSPEALGEHRQAFADDLSRRLLTLDPGGVFGEAVDFSYTLARGPNPPT
jgi:ubiquinone/menaquinone biosynthesis C-methylase UbiE